MVKERFNMPVRERFYLLLLDIRIFSCWLFYSGSRSTLFSATDPQMPEYCELLKADDWPVCAFISQDCRPANPSEEAHNIETSYKVWEKTLDLVGLPLDAVERLVEGDEVKCRYGAQEE
ncbi:hypothetical protein WN943_015153 [Citrus x changshan-huyou]